MKIGVGLRTKSSKITIHYGDDTWKGKVDNNDDLSTSSSATSSNDNANSTQNQKQQTNQSQIKDTGSQSQQTSTTKSSNGVGNAQDAVNVARAKYGDNNGNVHWNYMVDGTIGQPIKNPDGSYFVKGTADDGTMTGTQYSVNVHPDDSITEN